MGDSQDGQAQAQVLEAIDSVLRETSEFDSRVVDASSKPPASSVLERQAASDMMDAKYEAYLYYALFSQSYS